MIQTRIRPFPVKEHIGRNAYRLPLPQRYLARGRHASFNVDQLKESVDVPEIFQARQITRSALRIILTPSRLAVRQELMGVQEGHQSCEPLVNFAATFA
ncbi:hypothetical protein PsorP6_009235 [Peronosclerospora sorghi]|uniref:Uncharacterized protein n=1 Tax=Peronosclerospora sorghi TaxID=230839 RepID=A0ACC0VXB7_9STRA|nr:hypothetical protein PsorP6_009235 [Peronosclerospora sorghi]